MKTIFALHGFLGSPADWNILSQRPHRKIIKPDLFSQPLLPFWEWAEEFNKMASYHPPPRVLLGYSLGARLAMHALIKDPALWESAVFISGHMGLRDVSERFCRFRQDSYWANRFLYEPWDSLIQAWNAQSVFSDRPCPFQRKEIDFSRKLLSNALTVWSLGNQGFLLPQLIKLEKPLLWVAGEKDQSYRSLYQAELVLTEVNRYAIAEGAGHRVPWEMPVRMLFSEDNHKNSNFECILA